MPLGTIHPEVLKRPLPSDDCREVIAYVADLKRGGGRAPHSHPRAQLLAVASGSIAIIADHCTFVVPPERALWLPSNTVHETRHLAAARLYTLYVDPDAAPNLPDRTTVVQVNSLTRELLSALMSLPRDYDRSGGDGRLVSVLLDQIAASTVVPLQLPMPVSEELRAIAKDFLEFPQESEEHRRHCARAGHLPAYLGAPLQERNWHLTAEFPPAGEAVQGAGVAVDPHAR